MTGPPLSHDDIFEDLRRNGPGREPADIVSVGPKQPTLTGREAVRQTMRGLGQAGLDLLFAPVLALEATTSAVPGGMGPLPILSALLLRSPLGQKIKEVEQAERETLDEFYGRPESGAGRGVNLAAYLLGGAAVPVEGVALSRARPAARTVPTVRAATNSEISQVAEALRRAPPDSKEAMLLRDILSGEYGGTPTGRAFEREVEFARGFDQMTPEQLSQSRLRENSRVGTRHQPPTIETLDDLLTLRAFGSRRGPFSTSGQHAYDLGDLPPIADANEVLAFTERQADLPRRRYIVSEQMRDPDMMSGKQAQRELHAIRQHENELNRALRETINEEGIPEFMQVKMTHSLPATIDPRSPGSLYQYLKRSLGNQRGEIPIGPIDEQLRHLKGRPPVRLSEMSDADIAWATGRDDLIPGEAQPWKVVLKDGTIVQADNLEDAVGLAGEQMWWNEQAASKLPGDFGLENVNHPSVRQIIANRFPPGYAEDMARMRGASWRERLREYPRVFPQDRDLEILFTNAYGQELPLTEVQRRIEALRETIRNRGTKRGGAGLSILGALTAAGAAGTTAAAKRGNR